MQYIIYILLGACSYGILSTIVKLCYNAGFTPSDATGSQMLIGLVIMWLFVLLNKKKNTPVKAKAAIQYIFMGVPIGLTSVFYYVSVQYLPASIAILLLFQFIWIGLVIDSIALRKWPSLVNIFSVVVLLIGTYFAAGIHEDSGQVFHWKGLLFGFLSGVSYAFFIFFNGRSDVEMSAPQKTGFMLIGGTILSFLVFPPHFIYNGALNNGLLYYGLPLALFGAVLPPLLYAIAVPKVGSSLSSILSAAELPSAVLVASIFLQEKVSVLQWTGVVIIIAGIILPWFIKPLHNSEKAKRMMAFLPGIKKRA